MSYEDNLEAVEQKAGDLFSALHKLHEELGVDDAQYEGGCRPLERVREALHTMHRLVEDTIDRVNYHNGVAYHFRARYYVVKRLSSVADEPLTWEELLQGTTNGPWALDTMSLKTCRQIQEKNNAHENRAKTERDRGYTPGRYIWQIWAYDPKINTWSLAGEDDPS